MLAAAIAAAVIGALFLSGCSSSRGGEHVVFAKPQPLDATWKASANELLDLGVPALHSVSNRTVRITDVRLLGLTNAITVESVRSYNYQQVGNGVISNIGDLPRDCAKYVPHPVSAAVTRTHADSDWYVVIAFRVHRQGTYRLTRIRIDYREGNTPGWQYQDLDTTLTVGAPLARPLHTPCNLPPP